MTIGIIVVNIIVFVLMSISGSTLDAQYMAAHGAMYPEYIKDGQYWRLLTSMFMHFGLMHILNNMVVLGAVGQIVEKAMGHVKLLITFLVSGMCGSVLSYIVMLYNNDFAVSAGASGAIFGLVGALVWIVIANRGFYEGISRTAGCIYGYTHDILWSFNAGSGQLGSWRRTRRRICYFNCFISQKEI